MDEFLKQSPQLPNTHSLALELELMRTGLEITLDAVEHTRQQPLGAQIFSDASLHPVVLDDQDGLEPPQFREHRSAQVGT
jgi:hypothetical protein